MLLLLFPLVLQLPLVLRGSEATLEAQHSWSYPVKSVRLLATNTSDGAPAVQSFLRTPLPSSLAGQQQVVMAVHALELGDGSVVVCGTARANRTTPRTHAFALRLDSASGRSLLWGWAASTHGAASAVAQLPGPRGDLLVAGWREVAGVGRRCVTKLVLGSGVEVWSATSFGDGPASHGAFESIHAAPTYVLLAGFRGKPSPLYDGGMLMKSAGHAVGGSAVVQKLPLTALVAATPPSSGTAIWEREFGPEHATAKAARPVGSAAMAVLLSSVGVGRGATVALLRATDGTLVWGPLVHGYQHGEGTDLAVSLDGATLGVVGHGGDPVNSLAVAYGRLSVLRASTGTRLWTGSYSVGGAPTMIQHRCFGLAAMPAGGWAVGCSAGIPSEAVCRAHRGAEIGYCLNGVGDTRPGAIPRLPGRHQALVARVDESGQLLWQRVDAFRAPSTTAAGRLETARAAASTAAESLLLVRA
eukprot:COSAG01_NODE_210_length_21939_cov_32.062096_6_plen_472_part_00